MINRKRVYRRVRQVIADELGAGTIDLNDDEPIAVLWEDAAAGYPSFKAALERCFRMVVPDEDLERLHTVNQLAGYFSRRLETA